MVRKNSRKNVYSHDSKTRAEFSFQQPNDEATGWRNELFPRFVDRIEIWIRRKMAWDERDHYDYQQMAMDVVTDANEYRRKNNLVWSVKEMTAICSTIANRKIANAIKNSNCQKNSSILKSLDNESGFDPIDCKCENCADFESMFNESLDHVWSLLDDDQKRVAILFRDKTQTEKTIAEKMKMTPNAVRRIRDDGLDIARRHLDIRKRTKNKELNKVGEIS